jgi:hypothetical protein
VNRANRVRVDDPHLIVAETPDRIDAVAARASVGGDYHEAWHTLWSCRRDLSVEEVYEPLKALWGLLPDWAPYMGAVLHWGNLIEDIRIERLGCKKFPGSPPKMRDLQDLVLKMERKGREDGRSEILSVIMGTFRDLGLGYDTTDQRLALRGYEADSPAGYKLVTEGALKPLLDRAIVLGPKDDLGHFWLAMEVCAAIVHANLAAPGDGDSGDGDSGGGSGEAPSTEEFSPNQGQEEQDAGGDATPSKLPNVPIYKVGDRALLHGVTVEVTFAGLPDPDTGKQSLRFAPVLPD